MFCIKFRLTFPTQQVCLSNDAMKHETQDEPEGCVYKLLYTRYIIFI